MIITYTLTKHLGKKDWYKIAALAFVGHLLFDFLPSLRLPRDSYVRVAMVDGLILCVVLLWSMFKGREKRGLTLIAAFFAVLPDLHNLAAVLTGTTYLDSFRKFHVGIQFLSSDSSWALSLEFLIVSLCLWSLAEPDEKNAIAAGRPFSK